MTLCSEKFGRNSSPHVGYDRASAERRSFTSVIRIGQLLSKVESAGRYFDFKGDDALALAPQG
jgi:hypothetical protein